MPIKTAEKVLIGLEALAAPIAIFAGWLATELEVFLGPLGFNNDSIAGAIVIAVTFAVSSILTYLAETNLMRWISTWLQKQQKQQLAREALKTATPPGDS